MTLCIVQSSPHTSQKDQSPSNSNIKNTSSGKGVGPDSLMYDMEVESDIEEVSQLCLPSPIPAG